MSLDVGARFQITAGVVGQAAVDKLNDSLKKTGQTAGVSAAQTANAFRTLPAQFTDIATQLAGGQNPFLILLQQGGQIKDQFGGIGPTFRAFASVLTPVRLMVGGVAAGVGTLALAAFQGRQEFDNFNKTLAITGNYAGLTYGKFQALAQQMAGMSGASIGTSRDLLSGALGTGAFGSQSIQPVVQAMATVQKLTGETADHVVKDFASMSQGVARWAAEHNRVYNYLTLDQFKYIQALERAGKVEEAMAYNAKLLTAELALRRPELGLLEKAWDGVKNAASRAWDAMLNIGRPDTLEQQIAAAEQRVQKLRDAVELSRQSDIKQFGTGYQAEELKFAEEQLANLKSQQKETQKLTERESELAAARRKAIEDEASGLNDRKANARLDSELIQFKQIVAGQTSELDRQQQTMEALHAKALISDREYMRESNAIAQAKLDNEIRIAQREAVIESERPVKDAADVMTRANRVQALNAQIAGLQEQKKTLENKAGLDASVSDDKKSKALRDYTDELRFANELLALQASAIDMTDFEFQQLVETKKREHDLQVKTRDMLDSEAKGYRDAAEAAGTMQQQIERANYERSRSAEFGAKSALKEYADAVSNTADQIKSAMTNAFRAAEDALVDFVMTGKFNFKDLATSIIKDLVRIQIQQSIMRPLTSFLGSVIGSFMPGTDYNFLNSADRRATGGALTIGKPTWVGEEGPELIIPGSAGTVIPNHALGSMAGGSNISIGITVNTDGSTSGTGDGAGAAAALGQRMAAAARAVIVQEQRPGGLLYG